MSDNPVDRNERTNATFWLWVVIGGLFLLLLSWLFRFPWG
jgi:hypothetical protein